MEKKMIRLNEVKQIDIGPLDIPVYFSMCGKDAYANLAFNLQHHAE